mmetsp:Transcript_58343/g.142669  ORF Transcript_58343/g.142669 Transcript_58343/m.142669 type:complete len:94 (-) Transcript_58343:332-613(-)
MLLLLLMMVHLQLFPIRCSPAMSSKRQMESPSVYAVKDGMQKFQLVWLRNQGERAKSMDGVVLDAVVVDDDGPTSLNFKFVYQYKASANNIGG